MVTLYLASTLYHSSTNPEKRKKLKVFDHSAIYFLIAGTYTPFALVTLKGVWGWTIFGIVWGIAVAGVIFKLFLTGKYNGLSTLSYVLMGCVSVIAAKPLWHNLSADGLKWLITGGVAYLLGAAFYSIRKLPYNHAIFHFCVLAGTACHFTSVLGYVQ